MKPYPKYPTEEDAMFGNEARLTPEQKKENRRYEFENSDLFKDLNLSLKEKGKKIVLDNGKLIETNL